MLNRGVVIVRPRKPFLDWAATLDESGILPDPSDEQTVYLVPEFESDEEAEGVLRIVYQEVFERELSGWHTDETAWPEQRDYKTFRAWFSIELHSVVEDLCVAELLDDEETDQVEL